MRRVNLFLYYFLQNRWLVQDVAKNINDIKKRFRQERNTLKQQTRRKIQEDFSNGSPDHSSQLAKTKAYLTRHVGEVTEDMNIVLYQWVGCEKIIG